MITLTEELWEKIKEINRKWNNNIHYKSDKKHYGVSDYWTFPEDNIGDCEDYAVAKRAELRTIGVEGHFATCWTETGGYHAVLVIDTDRGSFVLDNRYNSVKNFRDLPYKWHRTEGEDGKWYAIS